MKLFQNIIAAGVLALTALNTLAADSFYWAGTGTGTGTLAYSVVPHTGKSQSGLVNPAAGLLTYLNVTTDTNGAVQFYNAGTPAYCSFTNLGTTIYVNITNAMSAFTTNGGIVLIYHKATGVYDRRILGGSPSGTNLVTTVATTNQIGDIIWPMATAGTIPVNATTKELNASAGGGGIYVADPGEPLLFEIRGGTNCSINAASARYP